MALMTNLGTIDISLIYAAIILGIFLVITYLIWRISRRIDSIDLLPHNCYGITLKGIVTYVADGDTFRFYHTPLFRNNKITKNIKTLCIRLYGIDAPEMSHFGKPAQQFSRESQQALSDLILMKSVTIKLLKIDRYSRLIAIVYRGWIFKEDISLKMLELGMACVYEGQDAFFDGKETILREKESLALNKKRGIWGLEQFETPRDYKNRMRSNLVVA